MQLKSISNATKTCTKSHDISPNLVHNRRIASDLYDYGRRRLKWRENDYQIENERAYQKMRTIEIKGRKIRAKLGTKTIEKTGRKIQWKLRTKTNEIAGREDQEQARLKSQEEKFENKRVEIV